MKRGVFEFEVSGKKRGFKFGPYAHAIAAKESGITDVNDLFRAIGSPYVSGYDEKGQPIFKQDPVNLEILLNYYYGAAVHFHMSAGLPVDFNVAHVSDWIEELGMDRLNEIFSEGLKTYQPKNSESPAEIGEAKTQSVSQ